MSLGGSFHSRAVLARAGAARARSILFASGDDLANLEGAVGAYDCVRREAGTSLIIWAHIANERLVETAQSALRTGSGIDIRFFDTYHIAAVKTLEVHFDRGARAGVTEVTILGFGKFGRDLFEVLVTSLRPEESFPIRVIDQQDRGREVHTLAQELGVTERVEFSQFDIQDLELANEDHKAFFLCTDDDLGNLTGAMMLASRPGTNHIYVRMTHWPVAAVADHLGEDRGVVFININALVRTGIQELPGVFEPIEQS